MKGRKLKNIYSQRKLKLKQSVKQVGRKIWTACSGITHIPSLEQTQSQFNPTETHDIKYKVKKGCLS
jgi:hypothetical protein